jgi:hypothetical protein
MNLMARKRRLPRRSMIERGNYGTWRNDLRGRTGDGAACRRMFGLAHREKSIGLCNCGNRGVEGCD